MTRGGRAHSCGPGRRALFHNRFVDFLHTGPKTTSSIQRAGITFKRVRSGPRLLCNITAPPWYVANSAGSYSLKQSLLDMVNRQKADRASTNHYIFPHRHTVGGHLIYGALLIAAGRS